MAPTRIQTRAVERFQCLGGECPDTCCQGWGMQLTRETVALYQKEAPELMDAVTSGEAEFIMRRDPQTDQCVKLEGGWCGIHRARGDRFLGDACHFFPRITRALGETVHTTAAISCPETARLMLYSEDGFATTDREDIRAPYSLKDYLPEGMSAEQALAIHDAFLDVAGDPSRSPQRNLMCIGAIARAIALQPVAAWADAVPLYAMLAEGRLPAPQPVATDIFNLVHATHGLAMATAAPRARLLSLIHAMADSVGASFDAAGNLQLAPDAAQRAIKCIHHMQAQEPVLGTVLRRYLQAQVSQAFLPFAGFGATLVDRATILGVRFATIRLGLATLGLEPAPNEVAELVATLARFTDHLGDPTLSLRIYEETGWVREARLRALVGDA
jgi:lysine-N-methylase